ncbi:MAG: glycosyltransferase [Candidatus Obscuribacterales bacterium]|nr:glycosyltransferase [Candidatus Obscuribacterales bacterium]
MRFWEKLFAPKSVTNASPVVDSPIKTPTRNILLMLPWLPVSGIETLYTGRFKSLGDGFSFTVVTTSKADDSMGDRTAAFEKLGCEVVHLPQISDSAEVQKEKLFEILRRGNFDVLIMVGCTMAYDLLPEIKALYPALNVIDELWDCGKHMQRSRNLSHLISHTIVPTSSLAHSLKADSNIACASIEVIRCGLNVPSAEIRAAAKVAGEKVLPEYCKNKFLVSFFGRLAPEKNAELFVEIVNKLKDVEGMAFCLVGDGPSAKAVRRLVAQYELTEKVYCPGLVESVDPLMSVSDLVVLPSITDGQPLVLLHAGVFSKPVIASRVGSIDVVIRDGENGFLVESGDLEGFCEKIMALYHNPELTRQLGDTGFKVVQSEFDEKMINRQFAALLN